MESNLNNKLTDAKQAERTRRTELGMLNLLIDKYPREAQVKVREKFDRKPPAKH
jgi:hypothetical protein